MTCMVCLNVSSETTSAVPNSSLTTYTLQQFFFSKATTTLSDILFFSQKCQICGAHIMVIANLRHIYTPVQLCSKHLVQRNQNTAHGCLFPSPSTGSAYSAASSAPITSAPEGIKIQKLFSADNATRWLFRHPPAPAPSRCTCLRLRLHRGLSLALV